MVKAKLQSEENIRQFCSFPIALASKISGAGNN